MPLSVMGPVHVIDVSVSGTATANSSPCHSFSHHVATICYGPFSKTVITGLGIPRDKVFISLFYFLM